MVSHPGSGASHAASGFRRQWHGQVRGAGFGAGSDRSGSVPLNTSNRRQGHRAAGCGQRGARRGGPVAEPPSGARPQRGCSLGDPARDERSAEVPIGRGVGIVISNFGEQPWFRPAGHQLERVEPDVDSARTSQSSRADGRAEQLIAAPSGSLYLLEQPPAQIVGLEQLAEATHRGFVERRLAPRSRSRQCGESPANRGPRLRTSGRNFDIFVFLLRNR